MPTRRFWVVWLLMLGGAIGIIASEGFGGASPVKMPDPAVLGPYLGITLAALGCEFIDSTLGMGYGTTLTPILLLSGFSPLEIVPAVLLSELVTGLSAALAHHEMGNVSFRRGSRALRVAMTLAACSILGTVAAVTVAIRVPQTALEIWIGILVIVIGITILITMNRGFRFSWTKVLGLGLLASFNKGLSGGGYGPLVTGGQLVSGVESRNAVAITSLGEGLTCLVGLIAFAVSASFALNSQLAIPLVLGAMCSVPISAVTVRRIRSKPLTVVIGVMTIVLGAFTLLKVLVI